MHGFSPLYPRIVAGLPPPPFYDALASHPDGWELAVRSNIFGEASQTMLVFDVVDRRGDTLIQRGTKMLAKTYSRRIQMAVAIAAGLALGGCSLFVTNTYNDLNDRPQSANWQLQKSTANRVLQCVKGSIDVCANTKGTNPFTGIEITPDIRVTELRALRVNHAITAASIHKGHAILALLANGAVPESSANAQLRTQADRLECVCAFRQVVRQAL